MPAIQALGVFCDDIREEMSGMHSIIGVYPDNLNVPSLPIALAKLALYVRIVVDPHVDALPMSLWLVPEKGQEREINPIDPALVVRVQKDVREKGTPAATIISRVVLAPFPIIELGRLKAVLRTKEDEIVCASINFQTAPHPAPAPSGHSPKSKKSPGAAPKKKPRKKRPTSSV